MIVAVAVAVAITAIVGNYDYANVCYIFTGGSVGALSSVIFNPFMTSYHNDFISAGRSGGSFLILLTALVAVAQGPGNSDSGNSGSEPGSPGGGPRFSVSSYFIIFGVLLVAPIIAYVYISKTGIGLRIPGISPDGDRIPGYIGNSPTENSGFKLELTSTNNPLVKDSDNFGTELEDIDLNTVSGPTADLAMQELLMYRSPNGPIDQFVDSLLSRCILDKWNNRFPWLRRCMPYLLTGI